MIRRLSAAAALICYLICGAAAGQTVVPRIETFAGTGTGSFSGDGGAATSATIRNPNGVAVDSAGNLYIGDSSNNRIRRVDASGNISTIAGTGAGSFGGDGGVATSAQINFPNGLAMDSAGNLYVADENNHRIRRVDAAGDISTFAGTGAGGIFGAFGGDGGPATAAAFRYPPNIALDSAGNLYIADYGNRRVRKVDASGNISTIAGTGAAGFSGDGGPATAAPVDGPTGIALDSAGNIYIADTNNHRIRKMDPSGNISTIAGTGSAGFGGDGGPATAAQINFPRHVALDGAGSLYIADASNHRIRRVDASGIISTIAGTGSGGFSGDGGAPTSAQINDPRGIAVDRASRYIYIADSDNHRIRRISGVAEPAPPPVVPVPEAPEPNQAPQVTEAPGAVELDPGETATIALAGAFRDPDGDPLTLSAMSSRPAVATARLDGQTLTVSAVAEGQARITVRATDPDGATATLSFLVTVGNPVSIGGSDDAGGMAAVAASAPEGGVAELAIAMAEPREEDVSFAYSFGSDSDPATADADAADHGGEGGTVTILAGETEATIRIPIADDDDIEPAREAFVVELQPSDDAGLAVSSAVVHVEEGVCDRTSQVADALRDGRACEAVTPADLERRRFVRLTDAGLAELHPLDFHGLAGMRVLILDGNGLSALPEGLLAGSPGLRVLRLRGNRFETLPMLGSAPALIELNLAGNLLTELPASPFENLPSIGYLYLGGNGIEALPADLLAEAPGLRFLELQDNALEALPEGFFAGVARLFSLQLQDNPGAPFSLPVELAVEADAEDADEGADAADEGEDEEEPGRATIQLRVPHAAPFSIRAELSAPGVTLSAQMATIAAGETLGAEVSVARDATGNEAGATVVVEITSVPSLPAVMCGDDYDEYRCFRGFELTPGSPLTLFAPAAADVPTMR